MSHKNRYTIDKLVSSVPNLARHDDSALRNPGGIVLEHSTIWSANNGGHGIENNITHYDLKGNKIEQIAFIVHNVISPPQIILLYDLLYLYKQVSAITTQQIIQIPVPNRTPFQPVIPPLLQQQLLKFLGGPNGYLTVPPNPPVDITHLVSFCVITPNNPNTPPLNFEQQKAFEQAHKAYINLSFDVLDPGKRFLLAQALLAAQRTLPPGFLNEDNKNILQENLSIISNISVPVPQNDLTPIGIVVNNTRGFVINEQGRSAAALLILVTGGGTIHGFNPNVNPVAATSVVDNHVAQSVYTGVTIADERLYVTDFSNLRIDVFNFNFELLNGFPFIDPTLPTGFSPINIVNIDGLLYILYAQIDTSNFTNFIVGPGNGFISLFNSDGTFIRRLVSDGELNVPWGLVVAPKRFKKFKGKFLVSNHGDGKINVYNSDWKHIGQLKNKRGEPIVLDGLWGLASHIKSVYFSSTLNTKDGLIGKIHHINH